MVLKEKGPQKRAFGELQIGETAHMFCAVPEIDLEPHEFADRDPKSGKWRRPLSKRAARNWTIYAAVFLAVLFFTRSGSATEFGLVAMVAFFGGVFAQQWLRDLY